MRTAVIFDAGHNSANLEIPDAPIKPIRSASGAFSTVVNGGKTPHQRLIVGALWFNAPSSRAANEVNTNLEKAGRAIMTDEDSMLAAVRWGR
jgi:hypothetical protein